MPPDRWAAKQTQVRRTVGKDAVRKAETVITLTALVNSNDLF